MSCVELPGWDVLGALVLVLVLVLARQIVYTPSWNFSARLVPWEWFRRVVFILGERGNKVYCLSPIIIIISV